MLADRSKGDSFAKCSRRILKTREVIAQRITSNGWPLRQLDMRRRKLEDHFLDVVMRGGAPARLASERLHESEPVGSRA